MSGNNESRLQSVIESNEIKLNKIRIMKICGQIVKISGETVELQTKWDAFIPEYSRISSDMGLKSTLNVQDNSYHG